jgi:GMP synthase (glutamine-hydrolysing)
MLRAEGYLRELTRERVPALGVCFGHQLLGQALGGEVQRNPRGREIGTVGLTTLLDDTLFRRVAFPLRVNATHVDSVVRLPPDATVLAKTELEPHAAVRFNESTWGVQFHPELDADIMRAFLEERRELITNEGLDAARLLADVDDAPAGASTLDRFVDLLSTP